MAWANQGSLGRGRTTKEIRSKSREADADRQALVAMRNSLMRAAANKPENHKNENQK